MTAVVLTENLHGDKIPEELDEEGGVEQRREGGREGGDREVTSTGMEVK